MLNAGTAGRTDRQLPGHGIAGDHDRQFVDNTVTECWIFEGGVKLVVMSAVIMMPVVSKNSMGAQTACGEKNRRSRRAKSRNVKRSSSKLSYKLQRELEQLRNCSKIWRRSWKPYRRRWRMFLLQSAA